MAAYILLAAVLAATPGPDVALAARYALLGGWQAAAAAIGGIMIGTVAWALAVALGLAAVVAATPAVFTILRLLGGSYLMFLGVSALLRLRLDVPEASGPRLGTRPFTDGAATNLLNPKVGLFYLTLLPQFVVPGSPVVPQVVLLTAIHAAFGVTCLVGYSAAAIRLGRLGHGQMRRPLEALTGIALLAFGALALAVDIRNV